MIDETTLATDEPGYDFTDFLRCGDKHAMPVVARYDLGTTKNVEESKKPEKEQDNSFNDLRYDLKALQDVRGYFRTEKKEASTLERQYHDQNKPSLRDKAKTLKYREKEQSSVPESSTDHQKYDDTKVVPKKVCHKGRDRYESTSDSNDQTEKVPRREIQSGYYLEVTTHEQQKAASILERQYHDQNKSLLRDKAKSLKYSEKEQSTLPESSTDHQKYDDTKVVPTKVCHKVRDRYESTSDSNDQTEHVPRRENQSGYYFEMTRHEQQKETSTAERQYHDQNKQSLREKAKSLKYREKEQSAVPESSTDHQKYDDAKVVPKKVCHKGRDRYESTSDSNDQIENVPRRENQPGYYLEAARHEQQKPASNPERQYHDQNKPSLRDKAKSLKYREKGQSTVPESSTDHQKYDDSKVVPVPKKVCHKVRDRYESTSDSNDQTEHVPRCENQSGYYLEATRHEQQKAASIPERQYHDQNKPSLREKAKSLKNREKEQSTLPESSTDHQKYDDAKVVPKKVCYKIRDRYESTSDSNDQTETVLRRENQSGYYLEVTRHEQQKEASISERQYHDQNKPSLRDKAKSFKYREKEQGTVPESSTDHQKYDDAMVVPKKVSHKGRDRYKSTSDSNDQTETVLRRENQSGYYLEVPETPGPSTAVPQRVTGHLQSEERRYRTSSDSSELVAPTRYDSEPSEGDDTSEVPETHSDEVTGYLLCEQRQYRASSSKSAAPGTLEGRSRYDSEPSEGQEVSGYLQCEERRYHSSSDSSSESASGSDEDRERQVRVRRVYTVNGGGGNEGRQSDDALPDSSNISSEGEMDAGDNRRLSHSSIREYDDDMSSSGSADTDSDDTGTVADQKPKRFSRVFVVNKNQSSTSATSTSSSSDSDSSDNNTDTELDCTVVLNYVKQIDESSGDVIPEDTEQLSFEASEQKEETLPLKQESYRSKKRRSRDRRNFNETRRNSSPLSLKQLNLMKSDSPVNMSSKSVSLDSIANTGKTSLRRAVSLKDLLGEKRVKVETLSYNNEDIGKQTEESQEDQATQNTTQTSEARDVESPNHQMEGIVTLADSIASNILKDGIFGTVESKNNMHTNDDIVTHEVVDDTTKAEDSAKGNQISKNARKRRKRRSLKTEESNNAANLAPETNIDNKNKQEDSKQVAEDIVQSKDIVVNDPNETVIAEAMIKEGNDQQMTDSMTSTITENVDTKIATNTKKRKKRRNSKPKDLKVTGDEQIISEAVTEVGRDTKEINVELDDLRNEKTSEVNIESENVNVEVKDTVEESDAKTKDDEIVGDNVAASAEACSKVERCETTTDTAIVKVKSEKKKRQRRKRKSGDMENIESKSNVDKDIDMTVALSKNDQVDDIALEVKTLVVDASLRTVSGEHEYFDSIEDSIIRAEGSNKDKSLKDLDLHTNIKEITDDDEDVTLSATEDDSKSHLATHTNKTNANSTKTEILRNETIANGEVADGAELLEMVPKEPSMTCKDAEGTTRPLTTEIHKENVPTKESQGRTGGTGTVEVPKGIQLVVPKQESTDSSTESIKRHSNKENTALESTGDVSGSKYTTSVPAVPQNERADGSTTAMKEQLHIESTNASEDSVGLVPQCEENAALERTGEAGVEAVLDYNEGSTASMEKESELKRRIDDANCSEEAAGVVPQYKGIDSSTERIRSKDTALGNPDDAGGSKVVVSQHDGGSTASMKKESDEKNEFKRSSDGINCPEASIAVVPQHDTTEGGTTSAKKETNEKNEFKRSTDGANSAEASIGVVPQHDTAEGGTTYTKKETNEKNEFKRSADGANCPKASIGVVPQHDSTEGGTTDAKKETNKKYEFKRSTDGANCSEASLGVVPQHDSTEGSTTSTKKDTNEKNECKRSTDGTNCSEASTGVVPQHESTDGSTEENNEEENASIKSRPAVANYTEPIEACAAPREAVPPEVPLTTEYDSSSPNLSDASAESLHSSDGDGEGVGGGDLVGGVASVVCRPGAQRYTSLVMITQQFATAADRAPAPAVSVLATGATTVVAGSGAGEGEVVVVRHTNAGGCSACGDSAGDVDRSGAMRCWEGQDDAMRHRGAGESKA
ncbi:unnamed protein product [Callosobruchus maculatus]|uniref:Uncharacterized protein n=1 Tax=Callosobruchus maculatus TaxID=64391 RepID=A0A653DVF2_CALMS|nr:unnamed protein product [Callosobruchus maculatus]